MKLLVVEDDEALAALLRKSLTERHYQLDLASDGQAGWDLADSFEYDLILLDWMLPRLDGLSFCQQLRAKGDLTPILLMTANEAQSSKIRGLDSGADDYLVKPFDFGELLARVRALLRRGKDVAPPQLTWGNVSLDPRSCEVFCQGEPLQLTAKEYGILELFLHHPQRIFNVSALLDSLWSFDDAPSDNAVRAHIKTLRRKLRQAGIEEMLETIYGLGYRLKADPSARMSQAPESLFQEPRPSTINHQVPVNQVPGHQAPGHQAPGHQAPGHQAPVHQAPGHQAPGHQAPGHQAPVHQAPGHQAPVPSALGDSAPAQDTPGLAREDSSAPQRPSPPVTAESSSSSALHQIWTVARQQYLQKLQQAETAIASAQNHFPLSPEAHEQTQHNLHAIKGGLGTFGLHQASELAAQAEAGLDRLLALPSAPLSPSLHSASSERALALSSDALASAALPQQTPEHTALLKQLSDQLAAIRQQLESAINPCISLISGPPKPDADTCLVLTQDHDLWQTLSQEAIAWDVFLIRVEQWEDLAAAVEQYSPLGLVLDWGDNTTNRTDWPERLAPEISQIPVIALTQDIKLEALVQVSRLGCNRYFPRTGSSFQILSSVTDMLKTDHSLDAKILVVDDDRALLQRVRQILTPWGLNLTLLDEPQNFLHTLEESIPDLVILDYEMPAFSGIDLCRVVRSSPQWENLPIVFLSAHHDPATLQSVFEVGADDYVRKPVNAPELVQRVLNRLERAQLLQRLADTDSLTGLSNRRKSVQQLNRLFVLARRQQKPVCFVELDIDHFKRINDEYGHNVGDRILQQLGERLRQTFRGEDVTARWGGEEFILGFYDASKPEAIARLNDLLYALQHQGIKVSPELPLSLSFSAGVAEYPVDGRTCEQLYKAADRALYRAKAAGRSRIFPYEGDSILMTQSHDGN